MEFKVDLRSAIYSLSDTLDLVGVDELFHGKRAAYMALEVARQLGMDEAEMHDLFHAALLHDCGVSSTRVHLALTSQFDWVGAKEHCDRGYLLLRRCEPLAHLADVVRFHHTYWDELEMYDVLDPKLKLHANLIFMVDRVDALKDQRSGVDILVSNKEICQMIEGQSGKMFSPHLVDAFLAVSAKEDFWLALEPDNLSRYLQSWSADGMRRDASFSEFKSIAEIFANVVDTKTKYTEGHSLGVARLARTMGELSELDDYTCDMLEVAGLLHDVGRLRVPDEIMEKPNPLDPEEFALMERYSFDAYNILGKVKGLEEIALWAGYHHEREDDKQYSVARDEVLPLEVQILNVVDVFQAMAQDRAYRAKRAPDEIIAVMTEMAQEQRLNADLVKLINDHLDQCWIAAVGEEEKDELAFV